MNTWGLRPLVTLYAQAIAIVMRMWVTNWAKWETRLSNHAMRGEPNQVVVMENFH